MYVCIPTITVGAGVETGAVVFGMGSGVLGGLGAGVSGTGAGVLSIAWSADVGSAVGDAEDSTATGLGVLMEKSPFSTEGADVVADEVCTGLLGASVETTLPGMGDGVPVARNWASGSISHT